MLTSPAITELTVESGTYKLFNEWLRKYFDGTAHAVGVNPPVLFPRVNVTSGESKVSQPLHDKVLGIDAEIRLVVLSRGELASSCDTILYQGKLITDYVTLNFWVSAKKPGEGQSAHLAQQIGELLKALCVNPDTRLELAQKGIRTMTAQGAPQWLPDAAYAKRLLVVNAQLQYAVQYSTDPLVTLADPNTIAGAKRTVTFLREAPLLQDTYLLGSYRWSVPTTLLGVHVTGWPPQGEDVILELEVAGVLTGRQVTIAQGPANVDTSFDVNFGGLDVTPNEIVRWKVVSAPEGEFTAWNVTVALDHLAVGP